MVNQTTRYALQILGYLARSDASLIPHEQIAREIGIPANYLSKILNQLRKSGIVESRRGWGGAHACCRMRPGAPCWTSCVYSRATVRRAFPPASSGCRNAGTPTPARCTTIGRSSGTRSRRCCARRRSATSSGARSMWRGKTWGWVVPASATEAPSAGGFHNLAAAAHAIFG
ncbi:MAG: Rrf2 family transcriptional regulator [bacterium]|nr:Rrf2 family transcriptional regulator [bacterium]